MMLQELILALERYWAAQGCLIAQPYDTEVGAGTMSPDTFFRVLGPEPWKVGYVQPTRRPSDGRYGENPFRLFKYFQYQVILKPSPPNVQDIYLDSLSAFGIDPSRHDIRFEEDNWESPTLGAAGVGWQVLCDGMEILNNSDSIFNLPWAPDPSGRPGAHVLYGEVRHQEEVEHSRYCFEKADVEMNRKLFDMYEAEAGRLLKEKRVMPAYDACMKCSHTFNLLDARGVLGVAERTAFIGRVRRLASACARQFLASREEQGFPLLRGAVPQSTAP